MGMVWVFVVNILLGNLMHRICIRQGRDPSIIGSGLGPKVVFVRGSSPGQVRVVLDAIVALIVRDKFEIYDKAMTLLRW